MARKLRYYTILACFTRVLTKDPELDLPPCPTNFQYLPQTLPMHCKMPSQPYPPPPPFPPHFPPFLPGAPEKIEAAPNSAKPAGPVFPEPIPMPMGPPMGQPMPMGPPMGQPMPMGPPMGMPGMPMGMPGMPMGMPMIGGPPQSKLPVIVMPFYSPDPIYKDSRKNPRKPENEPYKRKIRIIKKTRHHHDTDRSSDTDDSNSTGPDSSESDRHYWNWKNRRSMRRRKKIKHVKNQEYLTPILQYVSKDGYVIFEKKISKGEANDWLGDTKGVNVDGDDKESREEDKNNRNKQENAPEPSRMAQQIYNNGDQEQKVVVKYKKNVQRRQRKHNQQTQQQDSKTIAEQIS